MYQFEIVEEGYILEDYNDITYASEGLLGNIKDKVVKFFKWIANAISNLIQKFKDLYNKALRGSKYYSIGKNSFGQYGKILNVLKLNKALNTISDRLEKLDYRDIIKNESETLSNKIENQMNKDHNESIEILDRYKEFYDLLIGDKNTKIKMYDWDGMKAIAKTIKGNIDSLQRAQKYLSATYTHLTNGDLKDNKIQHAKYNIEFFKLVSKTYTNIVNSHNIEALIFAHCINNGPLDSVAQVNSGVED